MRMEWSGVCVCVISYAVLLNVYSNDLDKNDDISEAHKHVSGRNGYHNDIHCFKKWNMIKSQQKKIHSSSFSTSFLAKKTSVGIKVMMKEKILKEAHLPNGFIQMALVYFYALILVIKDKENGMRERTEIPNYFRRYA